MVLFGSGSGSNWFSVAAVSGENRFWRLTVLVAVALGGNGSPVTVLMAVALAASRFGGQTALAMVPAGNGSDGSLALAAMVSGGKRF